MTIKLILHNQRINQYYMTMPMKILLNQKISVNLSLNLSHVITLQEGNMPNAGSWEIQFSKHFYGNKFALQLLISSVVTGHGEYQWFVCCGQSRNDVVGLQLRHQRQIPIVELCWR
jgi:hypothetical protein